MIPIRRAPLPADLALRMDALTKEITDREVPARLPHARTLWKRAAVRRDVHAPLRELLRTMAAGLGCCMYCGHDLADQIDHHVPVVLAPVRAFCWFNHLLACSPCNSRFKRDQHRQDALGNSLLLDPTRDDPFQHLHLTLDEGIYVDLSPRGRFTIDACGLNRDKRPEARQRARRDIGHHIEGWWRAHRDGDIRRAADYLAAIRDQPFADVCQYMLRQAVHEAADVFFAASPDILPLLRRPEVRRALLVPAVSSGGPAAPAAGADPAG
ncbi:hypothetical protein RKE29_29280 [Streptomyces sp. B1866]|uniref:hypothetical protein n=1 Tax=Streptomyces sp. B1866 TaxID=3075431 RepID=UPI002891FF40|nr:hypothetical protein [Streptomyces sp. B1866]MDT3400647.1 hypothetical protein [Streptomyces sp. B1866]